METILEYTELIDTFFTWSALIIILSMSGTNNTFEGLKENNFRRICVIIAFNSLVITSIILGNVISAILFCLITPNVIKNYIKLKVVLRDIQRQRDLDKEEKQLG